MVIIGRRHFMIKLKYIWINSYKRIVKVNYHIHRCYEIVYYIDANGHSDYYDKTEIESDINTDNISYVNNLESLNKNSLEFVNNSLIFFPKNIIHNEIHTRPANVIAIGFDIIDDDKFSLTPKLILDNKLAFYRTFQTIASEYLNKYKHFDLMIESLIGKLLIEITRKDNDVLKRTNPLLFAKSYINEYFSTDINLDELAQTSGYSSEHFRFLFKNYTGLSPKAYILEKRLEYAKELLNNTTYSLNDLSGICGFNDYAQFSTFFKKRTNISPKDYRKLKTKG